MAVPQCARFIAHSQSKNINSIPPHSLKQSTNLSLSPKFNNTTPPYQYFKVSHLKISSKRDPWNLKPSATVPFAHLSNNSYLSEFPELLCTISIQIVQLHLITMPRWCTWAELQCPPNLALASMYHPFADERALLFWEAFPPTPLRKNIEVGVHSGLCVRQTDINRILMKANQQSLKCCMCSC